MWLCLKIIVFVPLSLLFWGLYLRLEINLIRVLGVLKSGEGTRVRGILIKYFLVQTLGSLLLLLGIMFSFLRQMIVFNTLLTLSLFIKLGAFPFHLWFINMSLDIRGAQF